MRLSPVHDQVTAAGAVFGSLGVSGFERPQHFDKDMDVDVCSSSQQQVGSCSLHLNMLHASCVLLLFVGRRRTGRVNHATTWCC